MFELLTFVVVVVVVVGAILENIRLKNKNTELLFMLSQSFLDADGIKKSIFNNNSQNDDVDKDHLILFLSETRDIAFNEIEKVQNAIKEFTDIADVHFNYLSQPGVLIKEHPYYNSIKIISEEYKKLKEFIPLERNDGR